MTSTGERNVMDVGVGNSGRVSGTKEEVIINLISKTKVGREVEGILKGRKRELDWRKDVVE